MTENVVHHCFKRENEDIKASEKKLKRNPQTLLFKQIWFSLLLFLIR